MGRKTGVTNESAKRFILDAGVVYYNWGSTDPARPPTVLGACRGGNSYTIETDWRDMPVDGVGGIVRGLRRPTTVNVTLTANLLEITKDLLKIAILGAEYDAGRPAEDEKGNIIAGEQMFRVQRKLVAAIPEFEYYDVALVTKYAGTQAPAVCVVQNAMATSNLELSFADQDEPVMTITFTGTFDAEDIDTEPWLMDIPEKIGV